MKIYSWNILYRNQELDRAFEFISTADFDVFCLQEVPPDFLKRLQTLPYSIAFQSEREMTFRKTSLPSFVVILSKHRIAAHGAIPFADFDSYAPLRTRAWMKIMLSRFFVKMRDRNGMYADISTPAGSVRVFNLHLSLGYPAIRLKEFERAMLEHNKARPTIVCGDFNILEKPHITPLNWILGGRVTDILLYGRERLTIEKRFVEHELHNPLRGKVTHPLSQSQLDHILVSHVFSIKNTEVIRDRIGSDHHPIRAEVE